MSDLLIKGLDAPKKCNGCCMNFIGHCMANKGLYVGRVNLEYDSKPDWCPAMNIQSHGRLIDADEMLEFVDAGHLRNPLELSWSDADVASMINSRSTIIPAEEE